MTENIRAFLSVDIVDDKLLSRITQIQGKLDRESAKMKLVERDNIHFTWHFFGDTHPSKIDTIHKELSQLEFAPIPIEVSGVGAFPNLRRPRIIWIGVTRNIEKLRELKTETNIILKKLGYKIESKRFIPHATIARVRSIRNREQLAENLESLFEVQVGNMTVTNIRMTRSTLTPSGAIYDTIWEIPAK
ncbi:MAG: RNA 2',3'-cyclic phosphodiesterase [Candidatus Thorarchaeota archaeon]